MSFPMFSKLSLGTLWTAAMASHRCIICMNIWSLALGSPRIKPIHIAHSLLNFSVIKWIKYPQHATHVFQLKNVIADQFKHPIPAQHCLFNTKRFRLLIIIINRHSPIRAFTHLLIHPNDSLSACGAVLEFNLVQFAFHGYAPFGHHVPFLVTWWWTGRRGWCIAFVRCNRCRFLVSLLCLLFLLALLDATTWPRGTVIVHRFIFLSFHEHVMRYSWSHSLKTNLWNFRDMRFQFGMSINRMKRNTSNTVEQIYCALHLSYLEI